MQKLNESIKTNWNEKSKYLTNFVELCVQAETSSITNVIDESAILTVENQKALETLNNTIDSFINENNSILVKYTKEDLKIDFRTGKINFFLFKFLHLFISCLFCFKIKAIRQTVVNLIYHLISIEHKNMQFYSNNIEKRLKIKI